MDKKTKLTIIIFEEMLNRNIKGMTEGVVLGLYKKAKNIAEAICDSEKNG